MKIRTERLSDYGEVYNLNYLAFGNRNDESRLIERIRLSEGFIPELSLVAVENDQIVGHALFSKAEIVEDDNRNEIIVLAPIPVLPCNQRTGIGGKLIQEGLKRSEALGYDFVFLIGHPTYYPKFGFKPAREHGFNLKQFNVSDNIFMFFELSEGKMKRIKGELRYPNSFFQ
ncbi:GNAT family N-acetyltransferase [Paenibacillus sp. LMG 31461]|uniref:GNAT family N-acetyltransferase n=1 Tax=Paenibacillus plantarum TaxID=2654975 RepID=A0ABX1XAA1_9BACL|nr:N-acetyltransferase [Paenibacillus plantarum]NOU65380.1 GNAT family N-acetyltransferase [Paenibacillus plantarum]